MIYINAAIAAGNIIGVVVGNTLSAVADDVRNDGQIGCFTQLVAGSDLFQELGIGFSEGNAEFVAELHYPARDAPAIETALVPGRFGGVVFIHKTIGSRSHAAFGLHGWTVKDMVAAG